MLSIDKIYHQYFFTKKDGQVHTGYDKENIIKFL